MSYRLSRLFTIFLILVILAPMLAACGDEPPDTPIASSTPAPTPTPLPVADAKGSKATSLPQKRAYTSPDLGFSVDYPGDWQVDAKNAAENGVLFYLPDTETAFWVQRQRFGGSADKANQAGIAFLKETNKASNVKDVTYAGVPAPFRVAGLTGLSVDYTYTRKTTKMQGSFIAVTTAEGDTYLITLEARQADYKQVGPLLDAILASFRISGVLVSPAAAATAPPAGPPSQRAEAEWLVMFYEDADDSILERDMMVDFNEIERVGSTDQVHLVAQVDRYRGAFSGMGNWTTTKRFYITKDADLGRIASPELADLGELNMADGATLADFVTWAVVNYPARKHALILSDHGSGWPGGFSDPAPGGQGKDKVALAEEMDDNLWLMELDRALEQARAKTGLGKLELIGFDACLMGMLEVYTQMAPHAAYAVASEEVEPSLGWAYTAFLSRLVANPAMDGAELAKGIVQSYISQDERILDDSSRRQFLKESDMDTDLDAKTTATEFGVDITLAGIDLAALPALNAALDTLADALPDLDRKVVTKARTDAQSYENAFDPDSPTPDIDLGSFVKLLKKNSDDSQVNAAADRVLAALKRAVIAERHGPERPGATGIALYFPNRTIYKQSNNWDYTTIASRFAKEHRWDDFLAVHYGAKQAAAPTTGKRALLRGGLAAKPIQISPLTLSAETTGPGKPVTIQTVIGGDNLGYVYSFAGRMLPDENALLIEGMDYVQAAQSQEMDGVRYPLWPAGDVPVRVTWAPIVTLVNDGVTAVRALLEPRIYGDTPTYTVDGTYTFADGSPARFARLYFKDGVLSQIFGYTGQNGLGALRQITQQPGDAFTVLEVGRKLVNGAPGEAFTRPGGTLTFGGKAWTVERRPAPGGSYLVGFIAEDLDGGRHEQYESLFVENAAATAVAGYKSYTSAALGFALLYPGKWTVEEDIPAETITFGDDASSSFVFVVRQGYAGLTNAAAANAQGIADTVKELTGGRSGAGDVRFAAQTADFVLGAFPARRRDFTLTFGGQPYRGSVIAATPTRGTTYVVLLIAPEAGYTASQAAFGPLLESFDILLSGVLKEQAGPPPPAFAKTTFRDTFSDPKSGLETLREDWGQAGYVAGQYVFELKPYEGPEYDYYLAQKLGDAFILQVAASYTGAEDNGYGLIFRVTDDEDFYIFRISGDGFFTAERTDGEEIVTLVDWTESAQIKTQPGAANLLTVVGRGDTYTLYVNGGQVGSFVDAKYRNGSFGVIVDDFDEQAGTTVSFDEYQVGMPGQ